MGFLSVVIVLGRAQERQKESNSYSKPKM